MLPAVMMVLGVTTTSSTSFAIAPTGSLIPSGYGAAIPADREVHTYAVGKIQTGWGGRHEGAGRQVLNECRLSSTDYNLVPRQKHGTKEKREHKATTRRCSLALRLCNMQIVKEPSRLKHSQANTTRSRLMRVPGRVAFVRPGRPPGRLPGQGEGRHPFPRARVAIALHLRSSAFVTSFVKKKRMVEDGAQRRQSPFARIQRDPDGARMTSTRI